MVPAIAGLRVRPLVPADLKAVARVHCAAFPVSAITAFGLQTAERYYAWQLLGPHDAVALGVENESGLIGFCFGGVFRGSLSGFIRRNRMFLIRQLLLRPCLLANELLRARITAVVRLLLRRSGAKAGGAQGSDLSSFGVLSIAVSPECQGSGAGQTLMTHCENLARKRGVAHMHLTVSPENQRAIAFYERLGWQKVVERGLWRGRMCKRLC